MTIETIICPALQGKRLSLGIIPHEGALSVPICACSSHVAIIAVNPAIMYCTGHLMLKKLLFSLIIHVLFDCLELFLDLRNVVSRKCSHVLVMPNALKKTTRL